MEAEGDGGEIEGEETVQEVASWMVVGGDEGVRDVDVVMPGLMPMGEGAACWGVQEVVVDVVLKYLGALVGLVERVGKGVGLHYGILVRGLRV